MADGMTQPVIYPWLQDCWSRFVSRASGERMAHALLLAGPAGTGKLELAQAMSAWLLCAAPGTTACGTCRSCRLLNGGAHPDRFEVFPEDERGLLKVDAIRELVSSLNLTTSISQRKVAVVAPAEGMNRSAANGLLKCLEEPPGDTVIILVSHNPGRLPVTIRSRCQLLAVTSPERSATQAWLQQNCQAEAGPAAAAVAAAAGSPLVARQLLQDDALASFTAMREDLAQLLGEPGRASASVATLGALEAGLAWRWLSMGAAEALKARLGSEEAHWLPGAEALDPARLARLQASADRNRALVPTTVRQDLLLHDWLLEWARQPRELAGT